MATKVGSANGLDFYLPTSGGRAGKGYNKTSTVQIRHGNVIVKQIRFDTTSRGGILKAIGKASAFSAEWAKQHPAQREE